MRRGVKRRKSVNGLRGASLPTEPVSAFLRQQLVPQDDDPGGRLDAEA